MANQNIMLFELVITIKMDTLLLQYITIITTDIYSLKSIKVNKMMLKVSNRKSKYIWDVYP